MSRLPSRRLLAGLSFAATASLLGVGAADAATPAKPLVSLLHPAPLALGASGQFQEYFNWTSHSTVNADVTVTVDARGLAKVADVEFSGDCTVNGLVAVCRDHMDNRGGYGLATSTGLVLTAKKGAPLGARGSYKVTAASPKLRFQGGGSTVEIGGPQFAAKPLVDHKNLRIGSTVSEKVQFTNTGSRPAKGAVVYLSTVDGLDFVTHYSNCKYGSFRGAPQAVCYPSGAIRLGETATLSAPVKLKVNSRALYTYLDTVVMPTGYPTTLGPTVHWTWGKGSRLHLTVLKAGHASHAPYGTVPVLDSSQNQPWGTASLYARNTADFAVTGSTAHAAKGHTAKLTFTLRNNGPATYYDRAADMEPDARVVAPPGTTIVGHSRNCVAVQPSNAGHSAYICRSTTYFGKGKVFHYSLTVRVDKVVPHARGSVRILWSIPVPNWRPAFDPKKSDDAARLVLN